MKLGEVFGKSKTGNPAQVGNPNRKGAGTPDGGQYDFGHHTSSLELPPESKEEKWAGYCEEDRKYLRRWRVKFEEAEQWRANGFSVLATVDWHSNGFTIDEAEAWIESGFESSQRFTVKAEDAKKMLKAGLNIEEACQWTEAVGVNKYLYLSDHEILGSSYDSEYGTLLLRGTPAEEVLRWRKAGCSLEDTQKLFGHGVTSADAAKLRKQKISGEETCRWLGVLQYISPGTIAQWKKGGFSPAEAAQWSRLSAVSGPDQAIAFKNQGMTFEEARKYVSVGAYTAKEAIRLKRTGADVNKMAADVANAAAAAREKKRIQREKEYEYKTAGGRTPSEPPHFQPTAEVDTERKQAAEARAKEKYDGRKNTTDYLTGYGYTTPPPRRRVPPSQRQR
jgi:hypothetical protein